MCLYGLISGNNFHKGIVGIATALPIGKAEIDKVLLSEK